MVRCPAGFGHAELVVDRFIFGARFSGGTGSFSGARFADGEVDRGYPVPARAASWSGRAIEGGEIPDRWLSSGQLAALGVPESVMRQGQAGSSVQLVDEGVDDHEADEDGKDPERPQSGCGGCAECGPRYGPGGFGYELAMLEMHDLLVLEALRWLQVLLWEPRALACVVHDGCFCR
jgi:hypothetical protein